MKGHIVSFAMLSFFSGAVLAGPLYSTSCEEARSILAPKNSMGFFMSEDCKVAYVLPPARGRSEVMGKTVGDLSRCDEMIHFNRALKKVNSEINKALNERPDDQNIKKLFEQRKLIIEQYGDLSSTLGASVELNFSNGIAENLRAFMELNPNADVQFVPVALKDVKLAWNQTNAFDPAMKVAFNQGLPLSNLDAIGAGSFNARLDLSLIGACPLVDPFDRSLPDKLRAKDVAGVITPNVTYQYELEATYKYHAEYNLGALARKIKESSTSGGLFKTSSLSSLMDSAESSGWFKFNMECDNAGVCETAKVETAQSIKQRLVKEVFDHISLTTLGQNSELLPLNTPGANGAATASSALKKCTHIYCQAAAVVLDVGNSIFGGTTQTEKYIKEQDHKAVEDVSEKRPVSFTGTMGFGQ